MGQAVASIGSSDAGLSFVEARPNPNGGIERLFLLSGNVTSGSEPVLQNPDLVPKVSGKGRLRIFHFNDLHNHLTETSGPNAGTHRFSQMVHRIRMARSDQSAKDAVLFLSIGDDHTGSVLDELVGWQPDQFQIDASYHAYSKGGVDASVLGNHEFDRGTEQLARGIRADARFPILSANVHSSKYLLAGKDYHSAAIAVAGGLRIGLVGLTTDVETRVGQPADPTMAVASPISALTKLMPALEAVTDVILIMSHCGFGEGNHQSGKSAVERDIGEADFSIARAAADLTDKPVLLLGAHTHTKLNEGGLSAENVFQGVPVFQSECNGRYIGQIDLTVGPEIPGGYKLENVGLHPIKPAAPDKIDQDVEPHIYQQPGDYDQEFEFETVAPLIARVQDILDNEIATVETSELSFEHAMLDRYSQECALLNYISDTLYDRMQIAGIVIDFCMVNAATIHCGIEPGTLSMGAWLDVVPYADEVFITRMSGSDLLAILDNNAKRILRPEELNRIDASGFVGRGFLHMSAQVRYQINTGESASQAVADHVTVKGETVDENRNAMFDVAMPTYLALGAFGERWNGRTIPGGVPGDLPGFDISALPSNTTNMVFRDEIAAHICQSGKIGGSHKRFRDGRLIVSHMPAKET